MILIASYRHTHFLKSLSEGGMDNRNVAGGVGGILEVEGERPGISPVMDVALVGELRQGPLPVNNRTKPSNVRRPIRDHHDGGGHAVTYAMALTNRPTPAPPSSTCQRRPKVIPR